MRNLIISSFIMCLGLVFTSSGQNPYSNPAFQFCPASGACSTPAATTTRAYAGRLGLNGSGTGSISFPAFTSTSTYSCVGTDETGNASVQISHPSASQANFTGTASHTISYVCVGY